MCSPNIDIRAAEAELARRCYYEFVLQTKSGYIGGWFLRKVADALQRFYHEVEAGKRPRMMIFAPPRSGKSELFSRRFPAWALGKNPDMQFISCSYADDLAGRTNRDVQRIIDTPKYMSIFPGTRLNVRNVSTYSQGAYLRNSDLFEIPGHTGSYRSAGIGGGITGMGADIAVIDDPVKDKAQAGSKTWRDAIWDWYRSVLYSRLSPKGGVLLGMTRWHEDDLAGRLLDAAMAGADKWEVLKFPATAEEDEEHRKAGEPLHPERFSAEQLAEIKRVQGSDSWAAMYQQRPAPVGGGIFDRAWWRFWKPAGMELPPVRMTGSDGSTREAICIPLPVHADEMIQSWDCLDSETQILSRDGWKGRGEVSSGDLIYSLNVDSGRMEVVPVEECGERQLRDGEQFVVIKSGHANIRVTEGHDFYAQFRRSRQLQPIQRIKAGDLVRKNKQYRIPISADCDFPGVLLSDDELRFVAWFITDGGMANQYVQITQSKPYKAEIRELLGRLKVDYRERVLLPDRGYKSRSETVQFLVPKGTKTGKLARRGWQRLSQWLDKDLSPSLMLMTSGQFKVFWEELMKGDGDLSNGYLCTARNVLADRLQQMAITRGHSSSLHSRPSQSGTMIWYVSARQRRWFDSNPRVKAASRLFFEPARDNEVVWCVQNRNGTLVTRRHGKVAIIGNCTFKDTASADFVAGHLWARVGGDAFLIDREHARMNFPTTLAAIRAMSARWPGATAKLIEDTANGPAIIQTLAHEVPGILPIRPMGGKVSRANAVAPMVEAGNVYLPHPAVKPWVNEFIEEASNFPQAAHDDDVDAMTQALSRLSQQTLSLESYGTWATPMPSISAF